MERKAAAMANLKKLGFSEYESRAYLKLLEQFPLNGYTLSKYSGIPRSRIYEVLNNLLDKQMVFEQREGNAKYYYPVEPDVFFNNLKDQYQEVFSSIADYAEAIYKKPTQDDKLVVIKSRSNILEFLNLLIRGAEKRIAMSIWEEDLRPLMPEIDKALKRGVILRGIYFGETTPYEGLVPHRRIKRYIAEKKERHISMIIDTTHTLSGIVSKGEESKVTWTRDEGFIEISEDYIAHDLLVNLYSASLDKEAYKKFEEFTENVLSQYFGYSSEEQSVYRKLL